MSNHKSFFAEEETDVLKAFPMIATIDARIVMNGPGVIGGLTKTSHLTASNFHAFIPCRALGCSGHGFSTEGVLRAMVGGRQGQKIGVATCDGGKCMTVFEYTIDLTYRVPK